MEATSFSQWAANLLGYSSHTVPIGFPPRTPDFNVEVSSERPSEGTKESEQGHRNHQLSRC